VSEAGGLQRRNFRGEPAIEGATHLRPFVIDDGEPCGEDLDSEAIRGLYFAGRGDGLTVRSGLGRLACAWRE
jgi:hypothetical protein